MLKCDGAVLQKNLLRPTQDGCLSSLVQVRGALGQERTVLTESLLQVQMHVFTDREGKVPPTPPTHSTTPHPNTGSS